MEKSGAEGEKKCFICETTNSTEIIKKCNECNKFYCHERCFKDHYDFTTCPCCFESSIEQPPIKISIKWNDFCSSCDTVDRLNQMKRKIRINMGMSPFEWMFGKTVTIVFPRSGDFDACAQANDQKAELIIKDIKELLQYGALMKKNASKHNLAYGSN